MRVEVKLANGADMRLDLVRAAPAGCGRAPRATKGPRWPTGSRQQHVCSPVAPGGSRLGLPEALRAWRTHLTECQQEAHL